MRAPMRTTAAVCALHVAMEPRCRDGTAAHGPEHPIQNVDVIGTTAFGRQHAVATPSGQQA